MKNIPTVKINIGKDETLKEVEVYQWLTVEEEEKKNEILLSNNELDLSSYTGGKKKEIPLTIKINSLAKVNKYLIEAMCKNVTVDEYNIMNPVLRNELVEKVNEVYTLSLKKN
jgi:hypothetical protein